MAEAEGVAGSQGVAGVLELTVRVKPGSSKGPLVEQTPDDPAASLTVFLAQRAVDGQANAALVAVLAKYFGLAKSRVAIVRGHSSRIKRVRVEGALG